MTSFMRVFYGANDLLAFFLELGALAALAWWGWTRDIGRVWSIGLAVAGPAAAGVLWGAFAAPKAAYPVPLAAQLAVKAVVFGAATLALYAVGWRTGALWFGGVVLVNTAVVTYHRTRG
ncbi:YrdB family protein [Streptomyces sp. NPDC091371]|uniref:YrdB family protein n=1 Tax=Streptomyces sp. NPDC091371 TaxID=3155303 RepID=UPI00344202F0